MWFRLDDQELDQRTGTGENVSLKGLTYVASYTTSMGPNPPKQRNCGMGSCTFRIL